MTKDEAMRIALEALVNNRYIIESEINLPEALEEVDVAIAVLRQALEQPDDAAWARYLKEPMSEKCIQEGDTIVPSDYSGKAGDYTEQESVYAFRRKGLDDFCTCDKRRYDELASKPNLFEVAVFYTAPPKREWVWLTGEEILACSGLDCADDWAFDFAHAIEAKLKKKNK